MGGLGEEDGDAEAAGEDREAGDVVLVLVGDKDGVKFRSGIFAGKRHAAQQLAAGEAGVDQHAGALAGDDGRVSLGAGGQDGHAHLVNIPEMPVQDVSCRLGSLSGRRSLRDSYSASRGPDFVRHGGCQATGVV